MKTKIFIILALTLFAFGCKKTEEVQTVDWYEQHNQEREAMLEKCNNNPGELMATPNCINASKARAKSTGSDNLRFEPIPRR